MRPNLRLLERQDPLLMLVNDLRYVCGVKALSSAVTVNSSSKVCYVLPPLRTRQHHRI
jgi:hypothetical protein